MDQYILLVEMADTVPIAYGPYTSLSAVQNDLAKQTSAASYIPLYPPGVTPL